MKRLLVFGLLLLAGCDVFSGPEATDPITEDALLEHLNYLADDSLYGRGSGTAYELDAAEYIREEFDDYGLTEGVAGWFQDFTYETGPSLTSSESATHGSGWTGGNAQAYSSAESSQNVLGVLPGHGALSTQWVVLGAHYDHIGFTRVNDDSIVIFNGADDNASGTSLMLEVARFLSHYFNEGVARSLDRRSVMFQAYGAEEVGLRGSTFFVRNPTVPLDSITAMVNLDMVGRLSANELFAFGTSSSLLWEPLLTQRNSYDLVISLAQGLSGRSDHAPFYEESIPVLFLHTGTHGQYHSPDDDVWLINTEGLVRVGNLTIELLKDLVVRSEPPEFYR